MGVEELNVSVAREREIERTERVQNIEELRQQIKAEHTETHNQLVKEHEEMCKLHEETTREIHELLAEEGKARQEAIELEIVARARDDQELNGALRKLINESASHECYVRNAQLQELNQRLNEEASEQNTRTAELRGSCDQLEGKYNELSKLQSDDFQSQSKNIESEHEAWKQALQEMDAMLRTLINESVSHENTERNVQVQDLMRRVDSHQDMNQNAFDVERKTTDEQIANVQNAMQNLARQSRGDAIEAVSKGSEGLKQDIGAKLANLKEELSREDEMTRQQLGQLAANTREQMVQLTDGAKEDSAKKVAILQGSISGLQNAVEQNRMAFREAREEQLRNMQSEREARNRQNAEIRADYKREIMKEHQDRMDHVADQRKDIFKSLRGGPTSTGQGASHDPSLAAVDGPNLVPGQGSDKGSGPQFAGLDGLSELDKKHSISSLGQRLSQMNSISPKPTFRTPQPAR